MICVHAQGKMSYNAMLESKTHCFEQFWTYLARNCPENVKNELFPKPPGVSIGLSLNYDTSDLVLPLPTQEIYNNPNLTG